MRFKKGDLVLTAEFNLARVSVTQVSLIHKTMLVENLQKDNWPKASLIRPDSLKNIKVLIT